MVEGEGGGVSGQKIKVAQNGLKHISVWNFLVEFFVWVNEQESEQPTNRTNLLRHRHHGDPISRSARWSGATKKHLSFDDMNTDH